VPVLCINNLTNFHKNLYYLFTELVMHFGIVFSVKDELYMPLVMPLSCELPN